MAELQQRGVITILSNQISLNARISYFQGRRIDVCCDGELGLGATVRLMWSEFLILAEVVGAHEESRSYILQIRHFLNIDHLNEIRDHWL